MSQLALRIAVLAVLVAPAAAQEIPSMPELPTMSDFRRAIEKAELPPAAETKAHPAVAASEKYSKIFRVSEGASWGCTSYDGYSTARAIGAGGHEVGIYRVFGSRNTPAILASAAGLEAGLTLLTRSMYKSGHKKYATAMNFLRAGVHCGAGAHNMSLLPR
ncbi:MAG: hypothetical protein HY925_13830 [Elusimicrobia bacterium]|nr:hypothetical protein [Elusimicrobiota bacterium]